MKCLNCGEEFEGNFCPACGQKASTTKLSFLSLVTNIIYGFTTVDRGIFHNVYYLTINPNKIINGYLEGRRKNVFNPISYAIIMVSLYLLLEPLLIGTNDIDSTSDEALYSFGYRVGAFINSYFKFFWLTTIVPMSLIAWAFFQSRNFVEHLAVHSFIVGHSSLIATIGLLFGYHFIHNPFVYVIMYVMAFLAYRKYGHPLVIILYSLLSITIGAITPILIAIIFILNS